MSYQCSLSLRKYATETAANQSKTMCLGREVERGVRRLHSGDGPSSSNSSSASKQAAESYHVTPWLITFGTPKVGPMSHAARVPGLSPTPLFEETKYSLEANVCDEAGYDPGPRQVRLCHLSPRKPHQQLGRTSPPSALARAGWDCSLPSKNIFSSPGF